MITFLLIHKEREVSPVAILVSFRSQKYKKAIGESVNVKQWNSRTKLVRVTAQNPESALVNDRITEWRKAAERTVNHFKNAKSAPAKDEFFRVLQDERFGKNDPRSNLLVPYFDVFIERYTGVRSPNKICHYKVCKDTVLEYEAFIGRQLRFEDIDMNFYHRFTAWFNTKNLSQNYIREKIQIIKAVVNDARQIDGLHSNSAVEQRGFSVPVDSSESIYLTEDELMTMYRLTINADTVRPLMEDKRPHNVARKVAAMKKARDMFLIGAFTGLRYSDYSRIKPASIEDGVIKSRNRKTGIFTAVPVHWVVQEIIDRGYDFDHPLYEQKLNKQIKDVARLAGFTEDVSINRIIGGHSTEIIKKKYELVSSHTARRSFATNAYKAGVPTLAIMKVTGHTREATFMRYIKISEKENAEMLKASAFFTRPSDGGPNGVPDNLTESEISSKSGSKDS